MESLPEGRVVEPEIPSRPLGAEKWASIEKLFEGEWLDYLKLLKTISLSTYEKHKVISDPRFIRIYDAMLFDVVTKRTKVSKDDILIFKLLQNRLGMGKEVAPPREKNQRQEIRIK